MHEYFQKLIEFNNWANDAIIKCLQENGMVDPKILGIMSYVSHAQHNWYFRVINQQQDIPVWGVIPLDELSSRLIENGKLWSDAVSKFDQESLKKPLAYKNMQGDPYVNSVEDVLAHVINHSTYHRGQVIFLIREAGIVPPVTDYIKFARSLSL